MIVDSTYDFISAKLAHTAVTLVYIDFTLGSSLDSSNDELCEAGG